LTVGELMARLESLGTGIVADGGRLRVNASSLRAVIASSRRGFVPSLLVVEDEATKVAEKMSSSQQTTKHGSERCALR